MALTEANGLIKNNKITYTHGSKCCTVNVGLAQARPNLLRILTLKFLAILANKLKPFIAVL